MKINIELSKEEIEKAKVLAAKSNYTDFRQYINDEFHHKVLQSKVGTPVIGGSSNSSGKLVTGPSPHVKQEK